MARINIEECWWSDPRRSMLIRLLGDEEKADGAAIKMWRLAQEFWSRGKLIPFHIFSTLNGADALIKSGLARLHNSEIPTANVLQDSSKVDPSDLQVCFVYVRGSSEYLSWAREQRIGSSLGGKKSALRERDAKGRLTKKSKVDPSQSKVVQASDSGSVSVSDSNTNTYIPSECVSQPPQAADALPIISKRSRLSDLTRQKMRAFIAAYANGWKEKYKSPPEGIRDKRLIGQLGNWIEHVSEARAVNLVETYLQISYRPFDENYHDLWQFFRHLNRIGVALDTGKDANSIDWERVFSGGAA